MNPPRDGDERPDHVYYYGLFFGKMLSPLQREIYCIQNGGKWKTKKGKEVGYGLLFHYKKGISILWPEIVWHRWNELLLKEWLEHRCIGVLGPTNSGKTNSFAIFHLFDYYCFPTSTTCLICSTTKERLEDRIWGEIKKFHKIAKKRYAWLPGNLIESRQRIVTDEKAAAAEGRDFRNGMLGVPCFLPGTMVDTPEGKIPIEQIKVGQKVFNAIGIGTVTQTHKNYSSKVLRVKLVDGRHVDCTEEHPFFTLRGWVNAIDLKTSDMVLSACETLQIMRHGIASRLPKQKILQSGMPRFSPTDCLQELREAISPVESIGSLGRFGETGAVLRQNLCLSVDCLQSPSKTSLKRQLRNVRKRNVRGRKEKILLFEMQKQAASKTMPSVRKGVRFHSGITSQTTLSFLQSCLQKESDGSEERASECSSNSRGIGGVEYVSGIDPSFPHQDRKEMQRRVRPLVSDRHSFSRCEAGRGDRWWDTPDARETREGQNKNRDSLGTRVEGIEVLELGSDKKSKQGPREHTVYNISVSGHPSYSVNGIVVHNCKKGNEFIGLGDFIGIKNKRVRLAGDELQLLPKGFIDCIPNLIKNPDCKITGMGNPKDTLDALGSLCEPKEGGWESGIDQTPKTKVWETKWPEGVCIQLSGSDSPNLDVKKDDPIPFPFLIKRKDMEDDAGLWGKDDWHYTMFNEGRMPRGQGSRRVLTPNLCKKMGALNDPLWRDNNQTEIAFLDAAYRSVGGDRCVFGRLKYGAEASNEPGAFVVDGPLISQTPVSSSNRNIIALLELSTIPISAANASLDNINITVDEAEDQIVRWVMEKCTAHHIGPENFFFDSGMRTSLVTSFSRLWSPSVNPIDCGGNASERRVSEKIDVKCVDYYSKFITELWWSVRLTIEARQFRGLTLEAMNEGCQREWKTVGKNKIEVETKKEMKLKTGRSPDLFDAIAIGVEGARRRGFVIAKLGELEIIEEDRGWKRDLQRKAREMAKSGTLNFN